MSRVPRNEREVEITAVDRERMARYRERTRQLSNSIRQQVGSVLGQFAWEFNDEQTRQAIETSVGQVLERTQAEGNVRDFAVVCDETNNAPEDVDQGRLNCSILLRPVHAAETVVLDVVIDPSQHTDLWGGPEIIEHEKEVKPALVKYYRKLNIPED